MKRFYTKARTNLMKFKLQMFADPVHTLYENFIIENEITNIVNTKLDVRGLMTIDDSLTQHPGFKVIVNKYTYSGSVEELEKGAKNSDDSKGQVTFVPTEYVVKRYQHTFVYNDMDVMQDPMVMTVSTSGAADVIANDIKSKYFDELDKISTRIDYTNFNYDTIIDALEVIGCEDEEGLFIIMGSDNKAAIRKDEDFIKARQGEILFTGQFGTVGGVPCLFSKRVPKNCAYVTKKNAVKFFGKKSGSVEQDRNIETKDNITVYERHGLIALVDDTKSVILSKTLPELTVTLTPGSGKVTLAAQTPASGYKYYYKMSEDAIAKPYLGNGKPSGYTEYSANTDLTTTKTVNVAVVKCKTNGEVAAWGVAEGTPTA